jgi:TolB-like protein
MHTNRKRTLSLTFLLFLAGTFFSWSFGSHSLLAETYYFDAGMRKLVSEVFPKNYETINGRRIAVFGFVERDKGAKWRINRPIEEAIISSLVDRGYEVFERNRIEDVVKSELKKTADPWFDENRVANVGKLVGADAVVTGNYAKWGSNILRISARCISVKDGKVLGAGQVDVHTERIEGLLKTDTPWWYWLIPVIGILLVGLFIWRIAKSKKTKTGRKSQESRGVHHQTETVSNKYPKTEPPVQMSTTGDRQKPSAQVTTVDKQTKNVHSDRAAPSERRAKTKVSVEVQSDPQGLLPKEKENIGQKFGASKQKKDPLLEEKLSEIASPSHLGEKVNTGGRDEYAYVNVHKIVPGCWIRVHHTFDNWLVINLLISPHARENYSKKCSSAVDNFKEFFKDKVIEDIWAPKANPELRHNRYSIDIKLWDEKSIFATLDELKSDFEKMS